MNDTLLSFGVKKKTKSFSVDIKDFFARYTTDVIGSCAFGIEANSLANPESDFIKNGMFMTYQDLTSYILVKQNYNFRETNFPF